MHQVRSALSPLVGRLKFTLLSFSLVLVGCSWSGTSPSIATQPQSQAVTSGQPATFAAVATGTAPFQYQWFRDGAAIAGATASSYTLTPKLADSGALFQVSVTNPGGTAQSTSATLTVNPITPDLALGAIPAKTFGDAPFAVAATSSSPAGINLAVSSGPATLAGSTLTATGAGTVVVAATQSAFGEYAGSTTTTSFTVAPGVPNLAFASIPAQTYGAAPFAVSAKSASPAPVTYAVASGPATIAGSMVTITGTGTVVLAASQAPDPNYTKASASADVSVAPAKTTLAFAAIPQKTFGDAPFSVSANSSSTGAISYSVVSGPATISGSQVTVTGAGTVVLSATQAADSDYVAGSATTSFSVGAATPALLFAPVAAKTFGDAAFAVSATSPSTGAVSYSVVSGPATVSGSTVTITGAGTVTLAATQAADANFLAATVSTSFTVGAGNAKLSFAPVATKTYGDPSFAVSATSASTGAISYAVASGPASLSGSTVTITGSGTVVLSATQVADSNYVAGSATTSFTINPAPPTTVALSTDAYDFGQILVGSPATKEVATVTNTGATTLYLSPGVTGDGSYSIVAGQSCGATLAAGASCGLTIAYAPTAGSGGVSQTAALNLNFENAPGSAQSVALTGISGVLSGTVTNTNHPQVAMYSVNLPFAGSVTVNFGPTTSYGRQTWTKSLNAPGTVNMLVAGMLANSTYHLQASVQFADGTTATDTDHTFTTGQPPFPVAFTTETPSGLTPQPGVEQLSVLNGAYYQLVVTDLQGRTLWSYVIPGDYGGYNLEGAKMMSNGDFLVTLGQGSGYPLSGTSLTNIVAVREIDLAGNTVRQITIDTLNQKLQAAGYNIALQQFHHDVEELPNGHWLVLSNTLQQFNNLTGIPGSTTVLGDVVVDLDENLNPVWVWNEFDHLDVNRHPWMFPDWTHTNAIVYSPTDGNLVVSMRHQNWVVKVDYENGQGSGNILWRLGEGGDFTLVNGTDPTDWNFAQHFPSFFSPNTAGVFSLGLMNNGDDRDFPPGVQCDAAGQPPCLYTSIPVFQIDENAMTATLTFNQKLPTSLYSFFGGNTELLRNGNIEYDLAGTGTSAADIFEITPTNAPDTVWHMHSTTNVYRGYRIPSLYPGVQW